MEDNKCTRRRKQIQWDLDVIWWGTRKTRNRAHSSDTTSMTHCSSLEVASGIQWLSDFVGFVDVWKPLGLIVGHLLKTQHGVHIIQSNTTCNFNAGTTWQGVCEAPFHGTRKHISKTWFKIKNTNFLMKSKILYWNEAQVKNNCWNTVLLFSFQ